MPLELEDKIISEFLQSLGPWSNHVIIGGGYAPIIYKLYLADDKKGVLPVGTRDIDSLIPRKIPQASQKDIAKHLLEAGFNLIHKDYEIPATEAYAKKIQDVDVEIEFLTDANARVNKNKNVKISGVVAQPLSYLKLSLATTIQFKTRSDQIGNVVAPGAWIFHKGITFVKRTDKLKCFKDLYGIWYVATQLGEFSNLAFKELKILSNVHQKWFKTFQINLSSWIDNMAPIDWTKLESQDPSGRLKKISFERLIRIWIESKNVKA